jgi:hypothetical protein
MALGFHKPFPYEQILRGDWAAQSIQPLATEVKSEILQDLRRIYETCLSENPVRKADLRTLNEAIDELSKFPEDLAMIEPTKQARKDLEDAWQEALKSGKLPGTQELRKFPTDQIYRLFALGRVQYLTGSDRLKNVVSSDPAYLVKMLKIGQFLLKGLIEGKDLSVEYIEELARQWLEKDLWCSLRPGEDQKQRIEGRKQRIKEFIDRFNEEINASGTNKIKRRYAIVRFCAGLYQSQVLRDANTRTFIGSILPMLLLTYGLSPSLIEGMREATQIRFSNFGKADQIVIKGQETFRKLMEAVAAEPDSASED